MRTRRQLHVNVESLEGKALLSALPVLSLSTYNHVLGQIGGAAGTFAKTHNENAFVGSLSRISYEIPYGHAQLFPTWQSDVGIYQPGVVGSGSQMVAQLKADLTGYVQTAAADQSIALKGNWGPNFVGLNPGTGDPPPPVLSNATYNRAITQIGRAAGTFAKTHNENAFVATLSQISSTIPYGNQQLFPTWESDVSIYDPTVAGSGVEMVNQLKADVANYVHTAVADGTITFH
jgi:hypothetical protein